MFIAHCICGEIIPLSNLGAQRDLRDLNQVESIITTFDFI